MTPIKSNRNIEDDKVITTIEIRGTKTSALPLWIQKYLEIDGDLTIVIKDLEYEAGDTHKKQVFTSMLYIGPRIPEAIKTLILRIQNVTIREESASAKKLQQPSVNKIIKGRIPPLYVADSLFTPEQFLEASVNDFTHFTDGIYFVKIDVKKTHIYSDAASSYACLDTGLFMQIFQGSGQINFGGRIHDLLKSKTLDFFTEPTPTSRYNAQRLMNWDEDILNMRPSYKGDPS